MRLDKKQIQTLSRMGIPVWQSRYSQREAPEDAEELEVALPQAIGDEAELEVVLPPAKGDEAELEVALPQAVETHEDEKLWQTLQQEVKNCQRCSLCKSRTQTVFGVGDKNARWMFIGEAPGADEDRLGEPFVGKAGQLLTAMIGALRLTRSQVYIANILKCRPPRNRDPAAEEVECCEPYLQKQLEFIRPKVIVALGRIAAQNLLKRDERIGAMRGRRFYYGESEIPVVVTYHPAYLLRTPRDKRKVWQDLCLAESILREAETA